MNQAIDVPSVHLNLSPDGFHLWAQQYLQCRRDFRAPEGFSPVPYFLLCRAIELELKAKHLHAKKQSEVKRNYQHDLIKAYDALEPNRQILAAREKDVLARANALYKGKGFEYWTPANALRGFSSAPDLAILDSIAQKLINGTR